MLAAVGDQLVGDGIADVEHRHANLRSNGVIDLVAGVRGDDDALGAAGLEPLGGIESHARDTVPIAGQLHRRERGEVEAFDRQRALWSPPRRCATPRLMCS